MYKKLSQYYDNLMQEDFNYSDWTQYLIKLFTCYDIKGKEVLDLGCGTGNLTIPLCAEGFNLTGLDQSEEMLALADQKSFEKNLNIRWLKGDMTKIPIQNQYDIIISCCDTLNYILDKSALEQTFYKVFYGLNEGGLFTFDLNTIYKYKRLYGNQTFTYNSDELCYIWENTYDSQMDIIEYTINFFVEEKEKDKYLRFQEIHRQRGYSHREILTILKGIGFKEIKSFTFNSFIEPDITTERIQYCALK